MLTSVTFLDELPCYETQKPYKLYIKPEDLSLPATNCEYITRHDVQVNDARGREQDFNLKDQGFMFHKHSTRCNLKAEIFEQGNEAAIVEYLEETIRLVKDTLKVERVVCFDWRVRYQVHGNSCLTKT